ncbi:MAG: hypothetical protein O7G85_13150 [Planctomycetota bacterium]|nr:hypothetical protein [Planctomycetota bacterium]
MDPAVAMVRAYLQANGYFTMTEVPVMEALKGGSARMSTDLDILAVRFPGSKGIMTGAPRSGGRRRKDVDLKLQDPTLENEPDCLEFIIGEVKEGRAELNAAATHGRVMRAALKRFGAFNDKQVTHLVDDLLARGEARNDKPEARVRLMAFGSTPPEGKVRYEVIMLDQMMEYFSRIIEEHRDLLSIFNTKDPFLGTLMVMAKAGLFEK